MIWQIFLSAVEIGSDRDEVRPVDLVAVGNSLGPDVLVLIPCTEAKFVVSILLSGFQVVQAKMITVFLISEALGDFDSVFLVDLALAFGLFCCLLCSTMSIDL